MVLEDKQLSSAPPNSNSEAIYETKSLKYIYKV